MVRGKLKTDAMLRSIIHLEIGFLIGAAFVVAGPKAERASQVLPRLAGRVQAGDRLGAPPIEAAPSVSFAPRPIFKAIRMQESAGDDYAIGDGGVSRGPGQCGRMAWQDGCEALGVNWSYDKYVWSRLHTECVMLAYWHKYKCKTDEQRARLWNGGPDGMLKQSTVGYWRDVEWRMEKDDG